MKIRFLITLFISFSCFSTALYSEKELLGFEGIYPNDESNFKRYNSKLSDDKWFTMSSTEVQYLNEKNELISILVQLRTLKSDLKAYKEESSGCFSSDEGNATIFSSEHWELIINPGQSNEYSLPVNDWGGFVVGTKHDGTLYNQSFIIDNDYELFFYFLVYGDCSNEELLLFYYDKSTETISSTRFEYKIGSVQEEVTIWNSFMFGNNKLKKVVRKDCGSNESECPEGSLKTICWSEGNGFGFCELWKFNKKDNIFYLHSSNKIDQQKFFDGSISDY